MTGLWPRRFRVQFLAGTDFSLLENVQSSLGTQPVSYSVGTWTLSTTVKRPGHETCHSLAVNAEVENKGRNISPLPICFYVMYRVDLSLTFAISELIAVTWAWMIADLYSEKITSGNLNCGMAYIFGSSQKWYRLCLSLSITLWVCTGEEELKLCAYLTLAVEDVQHHISAAVWLCHCTPLA